jgi:putative transposase
MTAYLKRPPHGYVINHKRVQRLMCKMGLQAIYPKPRTSKAAKGHKVYPYLLRHLTITRPNQVWSADITYIPMLRGFMYLVSVMGWPKVSLCVGLATLQHPGWPLLLGCA